MDDVRTIGPRCGVGHARAGLAPVAQPAQHGLLADPHTSAGRVPTDAGFRSFVDRLLPARQHVALELELTRREVDEAMRATTETLSQITNLLAVVTAPPLDTATIRHIEVLLLQPQIVMVVIITSTGGVSKRVLTFPPASPPVSVAPCIRACSGIPRRARTGVGGDARRQRR